MNDWTPARLGDLIEIKHGYAFRGEYFREDPPGQILLTPGNFAIGGGFQFGKVKYYAGPQAPDYVLSAGDLLVTMTDLSKAGDTLGYPAIVPADGRVYLHNQRLGKVLLRSTDVERDFIYWLLRTDQYRAEVLASCTGSTVKHTSPGRIQAFRFLLPPREQRERICETLNSLDDKIELNRRMNETLEAMAQAIFRDWFVDFGPVSRKLGGATDPLTIMGGLVQDTEWAQALSDLFPAALGDDGLPEGWRLRKVGDVAARVAMGPFGSRITKDNFVEHGVPVIRGKNVSSGFVDSDFVFLTPGKANELRGSVARKEDIVFTHRGTLGQVGRIYPGSSFDEYVVSQSQLLISVDRQQTSSLFLYYFFISDAGQRAWLANAGGAGVPAIASPTRSLKGVEFTDPGVSIAIEFDRLASCLEKRTVAAKHESTTLIATRDLLLPKLMSGEIRLSPAGEVPA